MQKIRWSNPLFAALVAALLFLGAWLPLHQARPLLPTTDLYTHLSVARHLVRGEGFRTDVTYPLSFAYPFARELPQPLITHQPGFSLLLTVPYLTAGRDPARTVAHTRGLQVLILGALVLVGVRALQKHGRAVGVLPWFVLLGANPLLAFAVDWAYVELVAALLLLLIWLRSRESWQRGPDLGSGFLWGLLILFRLDLVWVPLLWWLGHRLAAGPERNPSRTYTGQLALAGLVALVLLSPWLIRNARLTGQPLFTLQAEAEMVKETRTWPGYSVYRQLSPQPIIKVLRDDPVPVLHKVGRGLQFYWRDGYHLFPPLLLLGLGLSVGVMVWRRRKPGVGPDRDLTAPALAAVTVLLLAIQYSFFDHSLRHLLVLLPVLAWEVSFAAGRNWRWVAVVVLVTFVPPAELPGWENAARQAVVAEKTQPWARDLESIGADGVYYFEYSAGPWYLDRPGVWRSPAAEAKVPALLNAE